MHSVACAAAQEAGQCRRLPRLRKRLEEVSPQPALLKLLWRVGAAKTSTPRVQRHRKQSSDEGCTGRARGSRKRKALPLSLWQSHPDEVSSTSIIALPSDLLVQIFGHLNPKALRFVLPMVCRQW